MHSIKRVQQARGIRLKRDAVTPFFRVFGQYVLRLSLLKMPSLLSIPSEILDNILEYVILTERPAPADIEEGRKGRTKIPQTATRRVRARAWSYGINNTHYEDGVYANASALFPTCQQLNKHTTDTIARLFPDGMRYKLDVMFVDEQKFWPTWLSVPAVAKAIQAVDVTFRIFGLYHENSDSAFRPSDRGPEQIVWCFYFLLEHFLDHGIKPPVITQKGEPVPSGSFISVKAINMNFISGTTNRAISEDTIEQKLAWWDRYPSFDTQEVEGKLRPQMHPRWLATFVADRLDMVLIMSYHTSAYGAIVHERVGNICICAENKTVSEIEPAKLLARMVYHPDITFTFGHLPRHCRLLTFWNWKYHAITQRKALALPVPKQSFWPTLDELTRLRAASEKKRQKDIASGCQFSMCGSFCRCCDQGLENMLKAET